MPVKKEAIIESSSETINSKQNKNQPQLSQQEHFQQYQQQYNDYLREQYNNYMNMGSDQSQNKYNKTHNQYSNTNNPPYFYNSDKNQEGYGMDAQQFTNPFFAQNSLYGMPFGYVPYGYGMPGMSGDRNMYGNNVDPTMMMNMFTNYFMNFQQQQPNFYQNMPSDQNYQYNANYKK
jgi:hypothetical protein